MVEMQKRSHRIESRAKFMRQQSSTIFGNDLSAHGSLRPILTTACGRRWGASVPSPEWDAHFTRGVTSLRLAYISGATLHCVIVLVVLPSFIILVPKSHATTAFGFVVGRFCQPFTHYAAVLLRMRAPGRSIERVGVARLYSERATNSTPSGNRQSLFCICVNWLLLSQKL